MSVLHSDQKYYVSDRSSRNFPGQSDHTLFKQSELKTSEGNNKSDSPTFSWCCWLFFSSGTLWESFCATNTTQRNDLNYALSPSDVGVSSALSLGRCSPPHLLLFLLPRADLQEEVGPESRWGENRCLPLAAALYRDSAPWTGGGDEGGEEQGAGGAHSPD